MRAKSLEVFKAPGNPSIGLGANSIIYNLAFSPKIRHIDLSGLTGTNADTAEAIQKLVSISGALETLILTNSSVVPSLPVSFYIALGENKTLRYLDLSLESYVKCNFRDLGKAIAMNAKKNGSLKVVNMKKWINTPMNWKEFMTSFKVSD